MKIRQLMIGLVALASFEGGGLWSAEPEGGGASESKTEAAESATASLLDGQVNYAPPQSWELKEQPAAGASKASYVLKSEDGKQEGLLVVDVWPKDGVIVAETGAAIAKAVRDTRKKEKADVVKAAKVEKDKRFTLRIHEQYKKGNRVADHLRIYRRVGPRVVEVMVFGIPRDPEKFKTIHEAAENTLLSVKWNKPAGGSGAQKDGKKKPANKRP